MNHNTTSDSSNDVTYTFIYDGLGRKTTVKVGSQTLSTNVYENNRNGLISEVQYGNGGKVCYSYDGFDRLIGVKYDGESSDCYIYRYGANGVVAEVEDHNLGRIARTDYDQANRPCQTELRDSATGEALYKTNLKYNKLNQLEVFSEKAGSESHKSEYAYDRDNRVTGITYDGGSQTVNYAYDELGRVATRVVECGADDGKLTSTYSYVDGGYGTNSTTPLVKKITQNGISFEYTYDNRGNIISEKRDGLTTTYAYDAIGQLVRVNDPHENASWVYNYDRGGNILSKVKYAYTTGTLSTALETIPYTYGDSNWKDKLTSYNGQAITYDAIGNPLSDGNWTYEWQAGRQLKKMSAEGVSVSFKYDHNGMRIQKVLQHDWYPEMTKYTYHGKLLTHMTVDYYDWDEVAQQDKLHFFYDAQNRLAKVSYNGALYTYIHNLQGDIVGLLDSTGTLVVEYKYDVWGRLLFTTGSLADMLGKRNPFRYRGYVYDEESELYYLRSRYYSSERGRFLNADIVLSWRKRLLTHNTYAYCGNVPSMNLNPNGNGFLGIVILGAVLTAIAGTLSGCSSPITLKSATNLNRKSASAGSYNCYGNAASKQILIDPTGYKIGMSTRDTFNLVKADIGEDNITEHTSIEDEIGDDEYMVAMKCGPYDYHFIVYDNGIVYNKQGTSEMVIGCTIDCINNDIWYPHFHTDEQVAMYRQALEGSEVYYDDETIFFSIKRNWSD